MLSPSSRINRHEQKIVESMSAVIGKVKLDERDGHAVISPVPSAQQSPYTFNRRARPPPIDTAFELDSGVPIAMPKIQRKESKGGLRGMFTRNKSDKNAVSLPEESTLASPLQSPILSPSSPRLMSPMGDHFFRNLMGSPEPTATPGSSSRPSRTPSRMNLRAKAIKDSKPTTKTAPKASSKPAIFEPPPLFQSYPQAIKHAKLSASTLSADAVLRVANTSHKRNQSLRDGLAHPAVEEAGQDQGKLEKKILNRHRRNKSGSISLSKQDWTEKIFVLVTSGYLLQYSGEGSFDRLPEKMIQLGKDSVAFASDVIPGKHWVLQVSQSMSTDGTPMADSRSLLSRLAFRSADYRRIATSLLLVLDSAEEMDSWIAVLRKEIEALGGKKQVTETGKIKLGEKPELKSQPSHRYLFQKPQFPDQDSAPSSPRSPYGRRPSWAVREGIPEEMIPPLPQHVRLHEPWSQPCIPEDAVSVELSLRPDTAGGSMTNSASSYELHMDGLRDGLHRLSYCSSEQRTYVSSPATTPARDSSSTMEEFPPLSLDTARPRPNGQEISERRRSFQALHGVQNPIPQISTPQSNFRHTNYHLPQRPLRSPSPATPNFSVPVSSSKRFKNHVPEIPAIPSLTTSDTPETPKRSQKGPPTALPVARPLSPVLDANSPKQVPILITPTESSFRRSARRSSVAEMPSRSNSKSVQSASRSPSHRRRASRDSLAARRVSSFMPLDTLEVQDKKHMRRHSSLTPMQTFRQPSPPMESNGSCEFIFPQKSPAPPPSPRSHNESFENVGDDWEREKLSLSPLLEQPPAESPPHPSLRSNSVLGNHNTHHAPAFEVDDISVRAISPPPRRARPNSTLGPTLHYKASYHSDLGPPRTTRNGKSISNRRSMPVLMHGAPPAPPPNCALPPLPVGNALTAATRSRGLSFRSEIAG